VSEKQGMGGDGEEGAVRGGKSWGGMGDMQGRNEQTTGGRGVGEEEQ